MLTTPSLWHHHQQAGAYGHIISTSANSSFPAHNLASGPLPCLRSTLVFRTLEEATLTRCGRCLSFRHRLSLTRYRQCCCPVPVAATMNGDLSLSQTLGGLRIANPDEDDSPPPTQHSNHDDTTSPPSPPSPTRASSSNTVTQDRPDLHPTYSNSHYSYTEDNASLHPRDNVYQSSPSG